MATQKPPSAKKAELEWDELGSWAGNFSYYALHLQGLLRLARVRGEVCH